VLRRHDVVGWSAVNWITSTRSSPTQTLGIIVIVYSIEITASIWLYINLQLPETALLRKSVIDPSMLNYISISTMITYCDGTAVTQGFVEEYSLDASAQNHLIVK